MCRSGGGAAFLQELEDAGLLAGELRAGCRCDDIMSERNHGCAWERHQFAELLCCEGCLKRTPPSYYRYVANGRTIQDVQHRGRNVVLFKDVRRHE